MGSAPIHLSGWPLQKMVERIGEIQPPLPAGTSLGIGLAALIVVIFPVTWIFVRYFDAMAHEGSHAVMISLMGRKVSGVWLRLKDADGATKPGEGPGRIVLIAFIGYLGPSVFGLGAAKLISIGHSIAVLWLALGLLGLLLLVVRNVFGILVIFIAGLVIYDFARNGSVTHQTMAAYGIAWLLLLSGVRTVLMHWDKAQDAKILEGETKIMRESFAKVWLVSAIFAVFLGARLMM